MIFPHINEMVSLCAAHGITHAVISPGSRSAALSLAFEHHPDMVVDVISDERSAAFIALGMAQQLGHPVVLVCTSGTALYNYAPAIAEAYYQEIPLLVLSADRPPEWTNQYDGQTIQQFQIFGKHVKHSFQLPVDVQHPDAQWQVNRIVNESILASKNEPFGPVHINIPLREPFYPEKNETIEFPEVRLISKTKVENNIPNEHWSALSEQWRNTSRRMVVVGQISYQVDIKEALNAISGAAVVLNEVIGNMHDVERAVMGHDGFFNTSCNDYAPDLLITIGMSMISKELKSFLRKHPPKHHWHIQPGHRLNDSLQHLTEWLTVKPAAVLSALAKEKNYTIDASYQSFWDEKRQKSAIAIKSFMENSTFGEFQAIYQTLKSMAKGWHLHLANSLTVRYVNYVNAFLPEKTEVFCNRGTSGIDGCTSTAFGSQYISKKNTLLITGDVAFLYDKNAFWNDLDSNHLRILIINNSGGSIFKMIQGPKEQTSYNKLFQTHQPHDARLTSEQYGLSYKAIRTAKELQNALPGFLAPEGTGQILEIFSNVESNENLLANFKQQLKTI